MASRILRCAIEEIPELYANRFVEPHMVAFVAVAGRYSRHPALFDMHSRRPNVAKAKQSLELVEELLAEKSAILSQAQALMANLAASPDVVRKHHADMGIMLDQGAIEEVTATIP